MFEVQSESIYESVRIHNKCAKIYVGKRICENNGLTGLKVKNSKKIGVRIEVANRI